MPEDPTRLTLRPDDPYVLHLKEISRTGDHLVRELVVLIEICRQLLAMLGAVPGEGK